MLNAQCSRSFVREWNAQKGKWDVTGVQESLKSTQAYPCGYGRAMATLFSKHGTCLSELEAHDKAVTPVVTLDEVLSFEDDGFWDACKLLFCPC